MRTNIILAVSLMKNIKNGNDKIMTVHGEEIDMPDLEMPYTRRAYGIDQETKKVVVLLSTDLDAAPQYDDFAEAIGFTKLTKGHSAFVFAISDNHEFNGAQLELLAQVEKAFNTQTVGSTVKSAVVDPTINASFFYSYVTKDGDTRVKNVDRCLDGLDSIDVDNEIFAIKKGDFAFRATGTDIGKYLAKGKNGGFKLNGAKLTFVGDGKLTWIPGKMAFVDRKTGLLHIADEDGKLIGKPIDIGRDVYVRAKLDVNNPDGYSFTKVNRLQFIADGDIKLEQPDLSSYMPGLIMKADQMHGIDAK